MSNSLASKGVCLGFFVVFLLAAVDGAAQNLPSPAPNDGSGVAVYGQLREFRLGGGSARVEGLSLKRDRAEMIFDGIFYFEAPVAGQVRGAVFIGEGQFDCQVPPGDFERNNVKRILGEESIQSNFRTAVLRFSDDTFEIIGGGASAQGSPSQDALELAKGFDKQFSKETGANLPARLAVSILNGESPGLFFAQFDKGKRDRFSYLLDHQSRIPVANFDINGGEKGLIFSYRKTQFANDIWTAFYSQQDYQAQQVDYSDIHDLVRTRLYTINADVRNPTKRLILSVRLDLEAVSDNLRAVPFTLNDNLGELDEQRLKKAMRVQRASLADGTPLEVVQEDWEAGLTLYLPQGIQAGQQFSVVIDLEGDSLYDSPYVPQCYYPLSSQGWYPRHGYLNRSLFDLTFLHDKKHKVASVGELLSEEPAPESKSDRISHWKVHLPIALVSFGVGMYEKHSEIIKRKEGDLEAVFYSLPASIQAIKEDFILAEMMNSFNYFSTLFGAYPYSKLGGVYHPRGYGQGLASLLLLPRSDRASKYVYSFIAHETAHQWWGNIVAWRSYRDQWLSEGFAEYSGILYTALRDKPKAARDLIEDLRRSLKDPPRTSTGIGPGRLVDVGPLILGHRLDSNETRGAYEALIYNKGALVLRMLHFLFTDPDTGDGKPFFDMMTDFVERHRNGWATTESFMKVASEHFARTPLSKRYQLANLDWFFQQWIMQTGFPSYRMEYQSEQQSDGSVILRGTVYQEGVPEEPKWFMPLPVRISFSKDQEARGLVAAYGAETPFAIRLPLKPRKVELDPDYWVLSEKTSTKGR